jgi:hypothetical protein
MSLEGGSGKWELLYTTSASILGTGRPPLLRPSGPIYQVWWGGFEARVLSERVRLAVGLG